MDGRAPGGKGIEVRSRTAVVRRSVFHILRFDGRHRLGRVFFLRACVYPNAGSPGEGVGMRAKSHPLRMF